MSSPPPLITSVRVTRREAHDIVEVWNRRGALAGTLCVAHGDGRELAGVLLGVRSPSLAASIVEVDGPCTTYAIGEWWPKASGEL